jgi:hypothetical protein
MSWSEKDISGGTRFDDASGVHHGYIVGSPRDYSGVVGDQ